MSDLLVKRLDAVEYDEHGRDWWSEEILNPTWEQMKAVIRRMDKFRFPFIKLLLTETVKNFVDFEVVGGEGDYWIASSVEGYQQRRYFDPSQDDEEVAF